MHRSFAFKRSSVNLIALHWATEREIPVRFLHSTRSTLLALGSATLLLTAQATPLHAAQSPEAIAQAYGQLSVFVLDVAAGHDGQPRNPAGERAFQRLFAEQLLLVYPELDADGQQALMVLPRTRDHLAQTWPQLPIAQRRAIAQDWAAGLEPLLAEMPCELYVALERAELVPSGPYEQVNTAQLFACWDANPALAPPRAAPAGGGASGGGPAAGGDDTFVPFRGSTLPSMLSFMAGP